LDLEVLLGIQIHFPAEGVLEIKFAQIVGVSKMRGFAGFAISRFHIQNPSKSSVAEVGDARFAGLYTEARIRLISSLLNVTTLSKRK
jgi:hypothetical protein